MLLQTESDSSCWSIGQKGELRILFQSSESGDRCVIQHLIKLKDSTPVPVLTDGSSVAPASQFCTPCGSGPGVISTNLMWIQHTFSRLCRTGDCETSCDQALCTPGPPSSCIHDLSPHLICRNTARNHKTVLEHNIGKILIITIPRQLTEPEDLSKYQQMIQCSR